MTKARRDAVRARLPEIGADAMLVTKLVNVRYLTGFSGSAGVVLVAQTLLHPGLEVFAFVLNRLATG